MRQEFKLLISSTVLAACGAIPTYFALNCKSQIPADMQVVQLKRKVPPFFINVFRPHDISSTEFLLNDPLTGVRGKPFLPEIAGVGPHDILGFRNLNVPRVSDIVAIGDSQTYGNNALLTESWPARCGEILGGKSIYQMAVGSLAAPQYLEMASRAVVFQPKVIVIALYTGNDLFESFRLVYSTEVWKRLRITPNVTLADLPKVNFPPLESDKWQAKFHDGSFVTFTPAPRLLSNDRSSTGIQAGLEIVKQVLAELNQISQKFSVPIFVALIPTKELVYAARVTEEGIAAPQAYTDLVRIESENIALIESAIGSDSQLKLIKLLPALQSALNKGGLYPSDANGHPLKLGYNVIAQEVAKSIKPLL